MKCNLCKKEIKEDHYFGVINKCSYKGGVESEIYFHWTCWLQPYVEHRLEKQIYDKLAKQVIELIKREIKKEIKNEVKEE